MNNNNACRLLVGCEIAIVLFFAVVITSAARWAFGEPKGHQTSDISRLSDPVEDALLTDGAQASLCARWIKQLKPTISRPLRYEIAHSVARWSRNYGVSAKTVVVIIKQESDFNPSCHSATQDFGLLQLHNRPIYGVDENIRAGVEHYAGNLAAAHGDEAKALKFYNGSSRYARNVLAIKEGLR